MMMMMVMVVPQWAPNLVFCSFVVCLCQVFWLPVHGQISVPPQQSHIILYLDFIKLITFQVANIPKEHYLWLLVNLTSTGLFLFILVFPSLMIFISLAITYLISSISFIWALSPSTVLNFVSSYFRDSKYNYIVLSQSPSIPFAYCKFCLHLFLLLVSFWYVMWGLWHPWQ